MSTACGRPLFSDTCLNGLFVIVYLFGTKLSICGKRLGSKMSRRPLVHPHTISWVLSQIYLISSYSVLGVVVDCDLKFHSHIDRKAAIANNRTRNLLSFLHNLLL